MAAAAGGSLRIEIGGNDPVTGEPLGAIAGRSRSMHKSQGFGNFGGRRGGGPRTDSFTLLAGEPATKDIMDGVDTTWARVPGGAEVARLADEAVAKFDLKDPAASVPALLAIRERLASLPADPVVAEKRRQLDRAIQGCLGLVVETTVPRAEVVPGEVLHLRHSATVAAGVPVRWLSVSYPLTGRSVDQPIDLTAGRAGHPRRGADAAGRRPARPAVLAPRGALRRPLQGRARALIGRPENPPAFPVEHQFQVGGQTLEIADVPVQAAEQGQPARRLDVIAPVALRSLSDVRLFAPGAERRVDVEVTAARDGVAGTLDLKAPDGWTVTPASQPFRLAAAGDRAKLSFTVKAPSAPGTAAITAEARVGDRTWSTGGS